MSLELPKGILAQDGANPRVLPAHLRRNRDIGGVIDGVLLSDSGSPFNLWKIETSDTARSRLERDGRNGLPSSMSVSFFPISYPCQPASSRMPELGSTLEGAGELAAISKSQQPQYRFWMARIPNGMSSRRRADMPLLRISPCQPCSLLLVDNLLPSHYSVVPP